MRLKCAPSTVASRQLFLGKRRMNFPVADSVNRVRLSPALAFGQQVVLINAFARNKATATKRAGAGRQGLSRRMPRVAQRTFTDHSSTPPYFLSQIGFYPL